MKPALEQEKWLPEGSIGPKADGVDRFICSPIIAGVFAKIGVDSLPSITEALGRESYFEAMLKGLPVMFEFLIAATAVDLTIRGSKRIKTPISK